MKNYSACFCLLTTLSLDGQLTEQVTYLATSIHHLETLFSQTKIPLPPILSQDELRKLDITQKTESDELMREVIASLGATEFYTIKSLQNYCTNVLKQLRANKNFYNRATLEQLLDERNGLGAQLQAISLPASGQLQQDFFLEAYQEFKKKDLSRFYTNIRSLLKECFFDSDTTLQEPVVAAILQLCASAFVAQRSIQKSSPEEEKTSDNLFLNTFATYQEKLKNNTITELIELGYELNRLRIHPEFLKFKTMLYPIDRRMLGKNNIPLILFLRNPAYFITTKFFTAAKIELKIQAERFLFDKETWTTKINLDDWKSAFENEFKRDQPVKIEILLATFLEQKLPRVTTLTQLNKFFRELSENYTSKFSDDQKKISKEIEIMILNLETEEFNGQKIIDFLETLGAQIPEDFIRFVETVENDKTLLADIQKAFTESSTKKTDLAWQLHENIQITAVRQELTNLYRTPRSVLLVLQFQFKNKEISRLLTDTPFYFGIKPCGMLIRLFEYFIREVQKKGNAQISWSTLQRSLQCLNNPDLFISGRESKIYTTIWNALYTKEESTIKRLIQEGKSAGMLLAPVFFNFYIENNELKYFNFLQSLKVTVYDAGKEKRWGIYDSKLTMLMNLINNKQINEAIQEVHNFVQQTVIIRTNQDPFISFITNLEEALTETVDKLAVR